MFPKRFQISPAESDEWRCFFCLHVVTGAVLLGIWHLMLHITALTVLALLMRNQNMIMQRNEEFEQNNFLPTPLSKIKDDDNPYYLPTTQDGRTIYTSDIDMGALMTICTLSITLLMVYGAIKGKATHLLPFFCLQLFDFAIITLTATGYFCYLRSVHRLVAEHWHNLPFRNELLKLSPQTLSILVLGAFLITMIWKAYCIGVIWRCYKYFTLRQQTIRNTIHYILPTDGRSNLPGEPDYSNLLREHDASFNRFKQTPPPSYQDIMNEQPPPYPSITYLQQETIVRPMTTAHLPTVSPVRASALPTTTITHAAVVTPQPIQEENEAEAEGAVGGVIDGAGENSQENKN